MSELTKPAKGTKKSTSANELPAPVATTSFAINYELFGISKRKESKAQELGTMRENFGDDFEIRPCDATFRKYQRGESKVVSIEVIFPGDKNTYLVCSKPISQMLVDGDITMGHLLDLPLLRGESTNPTTGEVRHTIFITTPTDNLTRTKARHVSEIDIKAPVEIADSYKAPAW